MCDMTDRFRKNVPRILTPAEEIDHLLGRFQEFVVVLANAVEVQQLGIRGGVLVSQSVSRMILHTGYKPVAPKVLKYLDENTPHHQGTEDTNLFVVY